MGGRAGGGASGGMGSGSRGATERGYSTSLARAVTDIENVLKYNSYESLGAFDDTGKLTYFKKGAEHYVTYDGKSVKDKIVTHNHPGGGAFSYQDLEGMVANDMKEMRITAKEYTYSMKRPKKGWGHDSAFVSQVHQYFSDYARKQYNAQKSSDAAANRKLWIKLSTEATKSTANRLGWNFTVKKN